MDPVCHTLVGAALGRAGLARRSSLGMTALIVGANLPDIDVLAYFDGPAADLAFRRGWTHGVLALAVLPVLFTGALLAAHRLLRRLSRASLPSATHPRQLLLLSYLAVLTHPVLDTMNTYGVRWFMPFSKRWFYGDTLFIVDPWVWLVLGVGLYFGRKRRAKPGYRVDPTWPPKVALMAVAVYATAMAISGRIAEHMVRRELVNAGGPPINTVMVAPQPTTPVARMVVVARGDRYVTGAFRWFARPHLDPDFVREYPRGYPTDPAVQQALRTPTARRFLGWARFPIFRTRNAAGGSRVVDIVDLRYAGTAANFGTLTVPITASTSSPSADIPPSSASTDRTAPVPGDSRRR